MGRYYRAQTAPNEIDYAYQAPTDMMMKVVQNADEQIDSLNNNVGLLDTALTKVNYLDPDKARVQEINNQYKTQLDDVTSQIAKDPANWRKYMGGVKDLSRTILNDMTTGELGSIQNNYTNYTSWLKGESERLKSGKITADQLEKNKSYALSNFTGTNWKQGEGGTELKPSLIPEYVDINKRIDDAAQGIKPIKVGQAGTKQAGMYLIKTEHGEEWVSPDRVRDIALASLKGDEKSMSYLQNLKQVGGINDIDEYVKPMFNSAVSKYAYHNIDNKSELTGDPVKIHNDTEAQANARQQAGFTHEDQVKSTENAQQDAKYESQMTGRIAAKVPGAQQEFDYWTGIKNGTIDPTGKVSKAPNINELEYAPEAKNPADLFNSTQAIGQQIENIQTELKSNPNLSANTQMKLKNSLDQLRIQKANNESILHAANTYGAEQMSKKGYNAQDISNMFNYVNNINGVRDSVKKGVSDYNLLTAKQDIIAQDIPGIPADPRELQKAKSAVDARDKYEKMWKQWVDVKGNWYNENSAKQNTKIPMLSTTQGQSDIIMNKLGSYGDAISTINTGDSKATDKFVGSNGKKYNLDFTDQGILGYAKDINKNLKDVIKVNNVVGAIPGKGAGVQMGFVDPKLRGAKNFLAQVPNELLISSLGGVDVSNPMAKEVMSSIIDNRKSAIISDLSNAFVDFKGGLPVPYIRQFHDNKTNTDRYLQVTPVIDPNTGQIREYTPQVTDSKGNLITVPGDYTSTNDIAQMLINYLDQPKK